MILAQLTTLCGCSRLVEVTEPAPTVLRMPLQCEISVVSRPSFTDFDRSEKKMVRDFQLYSFNGVIAKYREKDLT